MFHLKTRGPQAVENLSRRLGVTAMAVRQHLSGLEQEGLVEFEDEAGRVGRPRRIWRLTASAASRFPDAHSDLALDLLTAAKGVFGADGLARLIEVRTGQQVEEYSARMPPKSASLRDKVAALTAIRRDEGYMAEWTAMRDGSFRLVENHCPVCAAARTCVGLCEGELSLMQRLLGPRVDIERTEYILDGDRCCAYAIRRRAKKRA